MFLLLFSVVHCNNAVYYCCHFSLMKNVYITLILQKEGNRIYLWIEWLFLRFTFLHFLCFLWIVISLVFTQRRSARIASAVLATAVPSVCLSIRQGQGHGAFELPKIVETFTFLRLSPPPFWRGAQNWWLMVVVVVVCFTCDVMSATWQLTRRQNEAGSGHHPAS